MRIIKFKHFVGVAVDVDIGIFGHGVAVDGRTNCEIVALHGLQFFVFNHERERCGTFVGVVMVYNTVSRGYDERRFYDKKQDYC